MSTCFYARVDACAHCGRGRQIQIGKRCQSSFIWRQWEASDPEGPGVELWTAEAWSAWLRSVRPLVVNEYEDVTSVEDFLGRQIEGLAHHFREGEFE